jgi:single-stranded-DNA-specific exonuclease
VKLIVTVDCGISDHEQVAYAKSLGLDVIILDHHEVPAILPDAVAVINPHREDCKFPFKNLAAVGIAFNFLIALRGSLRQDGYWNGKKYPNLKEYLDLVALGTIGDISPLTLDNRIFVKTGLELITDSQRPGIIALKEICGIEGQTVDTVKASFTLLPRINAAGRIASPNEAVDLLLTDDMQEARSIARRLDEFNRKRQVMEKDILREIVGEIDHATDDDTNKVFVFASGRWHPGVIGIVASRLVDQYCRPTILISIREGIGKGSGRSFGSFNIYQYLKKCEALLLSYGGHRYAAGISIKEENINEFILQLNKAVTEKARSADYVSQTIIDVQCNLNDIDHELVSQIALLAPFGMENPEPVMCVRNVKVTSPAVVGNNHLHIRVNGDGVSCNSIWFSKGQFLHALPETSLDIVFTPQISHWKGTADIQLKMRDIAASA